MFVGHGLAAFALVGVVARWHGVDSERALQLAAVAALFATIPDVDIFYGPLGLLNGVSGIFDATDAFWSTGNVIHRGPTHSLVLGAVAAVAFALWHRRTVAARALAVGTFATLVATATLAGGSLAGAVTSLLVLAGVLTTAVADRFDLSARAVFGTALVGLVSHPFGDLFTGEPPALLFPFDVTLLADRIALSADPTMHLLSAFAIELVIVWLAFVVYCRLTGRAVSPLIERKATLGVGYAAAALTLPAPTLDTSYHFVFSVLAVGSVGATQQGLVERDRRRFDAHAAFATGLAAISIAACAYFVAYFTL